MLAVVAQHIHEFRVRTRNQVDHVQLAKHLLGHPEFLFGAGVGLEDSPFLVRDDHRVVDAVKKVIVLGLQRFAFALLQLDRMVNDLLGDSQLIIVAALGVDLLRLGRCHVNLPVAVSRGHECIHDGFRGSDGRHWNGGCYGHLVLNHVEGIALVN